MSIYDAGMRDFHFLPLFVLALGVSLPTHAQSIPETIAPSAEAQSLLDSDRLYRPDAQWRRTASPAGCSVQREFDLDGERITLAMRRLQPGMPIQYALIGGDFEAGENLEAGFVPGSGLWRFERLGEATIGEREGVFFAGPAFPPQSDVSESESELGRSVEFFVAQNRKGDAVALRTGRIDLALSALEECAADELGKLGVNVEAVHTFSRQPRLSNTPDLMNPLERAYGHYLQNRLTEGTLRIRMVIDQDGVVKHCHAGDDLTPLALREAVCDVMREKGEFESALDAAGAPTTGYMFQTIRFATPSPWYYPGADGTVWKRRR